MKNISKICFLFSVLIAFNSCTDVVQVKLDEGSKLYIIDAFVSDLRVDQKIRVVTNSPYFGTTEPPAVANAAVVLTDLNLNKNYVFNYSSNGYYTFPVKAGDTISRPNHQYQLKVTIDGLTYTSLINQKRGAILDTILTQEETGNGGFGPPRKDTAYSCFLLARDLVGPNTDYYWIKTFRNDTLFNAPGDINTCIDGTGGPVVSADRDTLEFSEPATLLGFKQYKRFNTCKVEINSVTKETYFFLLQALQQINNGGLFATTPENVKTNIVTPKDAKTKAVGWFSMSTVASMKIVVK